MARITAPARFGVDVRCEDTFTRADTASGLGTTTTGNLSWVVLTGTFGITSNQAYTSASASNAVAYVDCGRPNIDMSVTIATYGGGANEQAIYFRLVDTNNYWRFTRSNSTVILQRRVSGSTTGMVTLTQTFANGDVFRVRTVGDNIVLFINGKQVYSLTDSALNTATKHGFGNATGNTTQRFDNFSLNF